MNLDELKSRGKGPARCFFKGADDVVDPRLVQTPGRRVGFWERNGAGGHALPAALVGAECSTAAPREIVAGLAARMRELDACDGSLGPNEPGDPGQRLN